MKVILVTGSDGQLGRSLQKISSSFPNYSWVFTNRKSLDITSNKAIKEVLEKSNPDFLINCAAYTAVDQAEKEKKEANKINALAVRNIAINCREINCHLIQLSTDYVYHNPKNKPLLETDATTPQSIYGKTKLLGEEYALKSQPDSMIIRTSWVYSEFGNNFVKTMLSLSKKHPSLEVVADQIGSPTYATDLASFILKCIIQIDKSGGKDFRGYFNFSNVGVCSWYDFAYEIFQISGIEVELKAVPSTEFPRPAKRPYYSVMSKEKSMKLIDSEIPNWRRSLKTCLLKLSAE